MSLTDTTDRALLDTDDDARDCRVCGRAGVPRKGDDTLIDHPNRMWPCREGKR